jgi:mycoredoxin
MFSTPSRLSYEKSLLNGETNVARVKVYGADWCGDTQRALQHLDEVGVPYDYIDVERDHHASEWVKQQNGGKERKPTIDVNGNILTVPSTSELDNALRKLGIES